MTLEEVKSYKSLQLPSLWMGAQYCTCIAGTCSLVGASLLWVETAKIPPVLPKKTPTPTKNILRLINFEHKQKAVKPDVDSGEG